MSRILHASVREPRMVPPGAGPWWDQLDPSFHRNAEPFMLEIRDHLPMRLVAASDRAVRFGASVLLGTTALPVGYNPLRIRNLERDLELYGALAEAGDPDAFFVRPPTDVLVRSRRAHLKSFRPWDGLCDDLSFESPFEPVDPRKRKGWGRRKRNRRVRARHWRHRHGPRPTIIAIHGFAAEGYLVNERFMALPWLYGMGCDVVLFTLPFHGPRQSLASPFSGHGFFAGGIGHANEAFAQGVYDVRILIDHLLKDRGVPSVGVTGVSLGGLTTSLVASVDDRLAFALPNVPVVTLPDLVLEWEPIGAIARLTMKLAGTDLITLRRAFAPSCPLTWSPRLPQERLMIIGGVGDRMAPPKHTRLLWDHWDRCRIHWFPGSHLVHLDRGAYLWQIARFLRNIGFLDADHPAPGRAVEVADGVELTEEIPRASGH